MGSPPLVTGYARAGDTRIAYYVVGDGGPDLLYIPQTFTHTELMLEHGPVAEFVGRLASFARVILFDRRGQGASDPVSGFTVTSLEEWMEDALAVMDAIGSDRASVFGYDVGGAMAVLLASTAPARVDSLVLVESFARFARADDYPVGAPPAWLEMSRAFVDEHWGTGEIFAAVNPRVSPDPDLQAWWARYERSAASPEVAKLSLETTYTTDVRERVPYVRQPALVLHARQNPHVALGHGRWLADHLSDARLVEYEGDGAFDWFYRQADVVLGEIEEFLTGERRELQPDRVLATVLFTDIIGSTTMAANVGDRAWRRILDNHDAVSRGVVERHGGSYVKSTGDGLLATFDRPANGVRCAVELVERMRMIGLEIRSGAHVGEIERRGNDIGGLAVHVGARVAGLAAAGAVLVTRTVKDLVVGSDLFFEPRGAHELKGIPEQWELYQFVYDTQRDA